MDKTKGTEYQNIFEMLYSWRQVAGKLESGEISKEEYDCWRYKYPELDATKPGCKRILVPQDLRDLVVEALKEDE